MPTHPHAPLEPDYKFCPKCGGGLERRIVEAHDPRARLVCRACGFIFYIDPKVAVGTVVRGEKGFLILRRAIEPGYGKWVFPGGYVDRGESLEGAAVREALEETGLDVRLGALVNIYSFARRGIIMIIYEAEAAPGTPKVNLESLELRWVGPGEIPWDDLAFPSTRSAFRDYFLRHGLAEHVPPGLDPGEEF